MKKTYYKTKGKYPPKFLGNTKGKDVSNNRLVPFYRDRLFSLWDKTIISVSKEYRKIIIIDLLNAEALYYTYNKINKYKYQKNNFFWHWNENDVNYYLVFFLLL